MKKPTGGLVQKKSKGGKVNVANMVYSKTKTGKAGKGKIISKLQGA
jgi:hypothetical protein